MITERGSGLKKFTISANVCTVFVMSSIAHAASVQLLVYLV